MKIVTWNCNGGFRKKTAEADSLNADVLLIQECEDPKQSTKEYREWAGEHLWIGTSKNKGIGVFPKNDHKVEALNWNGTFKIQGLNTTCQSIEWSTCDLKLFLPFKINDDKTVLGVWSKGSDSEVFSYIGQFWKYLQIHRQQLSIPEILIMGDFNSNKIWDKADRWWSHSSVVNELATLDINSLYHSQKNEEQGQEKTPTFYHHRKKEKPYHIDYVFCSNEILSKATLEIGEFDKWVNVSDHMPLSVTIKN